MRKKGIDKSKKMQGNQFQKKIASNVSPMKKHNKLYKLRFENSKRKSRPEKWLDLKKKGPKKKLYKELLKRLSKRGSDNNS